VPQQDLPALVLVHGAWHRKEMWRRLISELPPRIDIRTPQLPSCAPVPPEQLGDLYDDAAAIRAAVDGVGGPCVVVAHSYGAAPASQALPGADNVRRVVFISGFQLDVGESILSHTGGAPAPWMQADENGIYYDMTMPREVFYQDMAAEDAAAAAAALGPQNLASCEQTLTQAVWRTGTFVTHIYGEDEAFAPAFKQFGEQRSDKVRSLPGGHSPFLARPAALAALLLEELKEATQDA
jgi:pimeloyl-ACP methyl ester carboxylesterase